MWFYRLGLTKTKLLALTGDSISGKEAAEMNLINKAVERIQAGKITPEKAAENLFKPCMCGIFNPHRAAKLLKLLAEKTD